MTVEVVTPEEFVGPVQGDLNGRRGQITGIEMRAQNQVVRRGRRWRRCSDT